jgi:hypothetical protein
MKTKIRTIKVTQRDIEKGLRRSASSCPVARAINRVHKKGTPSLATVGPNTITIGYNTMRTPPIVRAFIDAFDMGVKRRPFSFTLEY